jgi:predicted transposase/invertase (TIGR01784 family)
MQEEQQIDEDYLCNLVELMNRLIGVVAWDADNVKDEVMDMGGKVLELQSDKFRQEISQSRQEAMQEGRREGKREGKREGRREAIAMMVVNMSKNNMTTQQIASIARLSEDEVEKILDREQ